MVVFNDCRTDFMSMLSSGHIRKMCEKMAKIYILMLSLICF